MTSVEETKALDRRDGAGTIAATVRCIISEIELDGVDAVRRYSAQLDRWTPEVFEIGEADVAACRESLKPGAREALEFAAAQIRAFAELQLSSINEVEAEIYPGITLGHRHIPVDSVGCYVPGGLYPLAASALMTIVPAKVAGVRNVLATTPPLRGALSRTSIAAMSIAGADRIFCLGGAQAIAAMAFGVAGFDPVDMIVGPGNSYVTEAKRQLFGKVGIDLLAGPTEVLLIADESADAVLCAVDLLGQAEHGPTTRAALITNSAELASAVSSLITSMLDADEHDSVRAAAWKDHGQIHVRATEDELVALADDLAFEHVQVMTRSPNNYLNRLRNYGTLFLGDAANVAYGDKVIGTNHTLPTQRSARYSGGLWAGTYLKTCTYQSVSTDVASATLARHCIEICDLEGLPGHREQADIRLRRLTARNAMRGA